LVGLSSYYRRHQKNHALVARPITQLTKKDVGFVWGKDQEDSFLRLKAALLKSTVMAHPDYTKTFYVMTDASMIAIGAVLAQYDDDGKEHIVACISRTLKEVEQRYPGSEQEALAAYWSVTRLKDYLWGTQFVVVTDHQNLKSLFKCHSGRLGRWAAALSQFKMSICFRAGKLNQVDSLSGVKIPNADDTRRVFAVDRIDFGISNSQGNNPSN